MAARKKGRKGRKGTKAKGTRAGAGSGRKAAARRPSRAAFVTAKPISLKRLMGNLASAHMLSAAPKGACLVTDPNTGSARCTLATRDFCKNVLKGTFIGGPCGG
jgi:hypothetical protein